MVGIPKPNQKSKGKNQKSKNGRAGQASPRDSRSAGIANF
jgi:hypothetical protein